jgi:hypothetical protein
MEDPEWWVVLTPACDLEHAGKAEFALLGQALPLTANAKYITWAASPSKASWNQLNDILIGKSARYYYLPEFREIPDLLLDLERVRSILVPDLEEFTRVASLVAPYSEALLAKNSQFRGRIGTPDLNSKSVQDRLTESLVRQSPFGT